MLFPLSEPRFLRFHLLGEFLPQHFFLFFELGVVQLLHLRLAKFTCLHLCLPVILIVQFLRRRDEVKHMRPNEKRTKLLEVTVVLVFD